MVIPTMMCLILISAWGGAGARTAMRVGRPPGRNKWHISAPGVPGGSQEWVRLRNEGSSRASASVTFHSETGASHSVEVEVPADSAVSLRASDYVERPGRDTEIEADGPLTASLDTRVPPGPPDPGGRALAVARSQLGKPYSYGAAGPSAFDCSGLAQFCFAAGAGISLPRSSYDQGHVGSPVAAADLRPGDILGFRGWGHVGIYLGQGQYIHAPHSGDVVKVSSLAERRDLCGAVRI